MKTLEQLSVMELKAAIFDHSEQIKFSQHAMKTLYERLPLQAKIESEANKIQAMEAAAIVTLAKQQKPKLSEVKKG